VLPLFEAKARHWCAKGHAVERMYFAGQSHVGTTIQGNGPALEWIGQRFADQPASGNCGT